VIKSESQRLADLVQVARQKHVLVIALKSEGGL